MKALLFSCACILGTSFWGVSQNIEIKLDGMGADLSGSSYDVNVTEATLAQNGGIFTAHFVVTNNTENNGKWQIMRKKITVPATWEDQVCWPPSCYNASGDIYYTPSSSDYVPTIMAGSDTTSNGELAEIKANINTEIQVRTKDETDLERVKIKYGDEMLQTLIKFNLAYNGFRAWRRWRFSPQMLMRRTNV